MSESSAPRPCCCRSPVSGSASCCFTPSVSSSVGCRWSDTSRSGKTPFAALLYIVLPVATLVLHEIGVLIRMARASTLEVLRLDYITNARAKGLSEPAILVRHAFRNAFGPTWTLIGLVLGNLLAGIAVIETVFTIPGLGQLLVDSIFGRDYPVIQGCLLFIAFTYVVTNLVIDLLYPLFDPRVTAQ
jgi:peptide/nickel transport system permease protein